MLTFLGTYLLTKENELTKVLKVLTKVLTKENEMSTFWVD